MSTVKRFPFTWILGWSLSRYNEFSICKRRYYYQYYAKYDPEFSRDEINGLKELTSVPLGIGVTVHHVIRALLNRLRSTHEVIDREKFFDYARRSTLEHIESKTFAEVYYGDAETVGLNDLYPKVQECLENLLSSDRFEWLTEEAIKTSDAWIIEPPGYGETRINDLKAYAKVDFLFPMDDHLYILDWKTGKRELEKHRKQLIGYAAWASYHFDFEPEVIKPIVAYLLPEYEEIHQELNEFDIEDFAVRVRTETEEMYGFCSDVENNVPVDKSEFVKINDERITSRCNFRELCFPEEYPSAI
ncbi:MAG: hypothetical protein GTO18_10525 [Anaerolineales bacterium]|nr:hypothetical protein [Anaerolineales bacterium]